MTFKILISVKLKKVKFGNYPVNPQRAICIVCDYTVIDQATIAPDTLQKNGAIRFSWRDKVWPNYSKYEAKT